MSDSPRPLPALDPVALVDPVVAIVREAGAAILAIYHSGDFGATAKADDSPLTLADLASHRVIVAELEKLTPDIPVLSEESAAAGFDVRRHWHSYWLIDPLDGTREFVARNGEFTVNVALIVGHDPVLGVVGVPARGQIYTGIPGRGAFRRDGAAAPTPIAIRHPAPPPVRVVGSRSHRGDSLDAFLARLGAHELVPTGSALKFCIVAEGGADVYPRLGPTSEWDTAAAQAVLVAAGGRVVTTRGEVLRYNAKAEILNPFFVAYGDASRDWIALLAG
jgi:3'(2'), 5'-bisphosphate nucleotidase